MNHNANQSAVTGGIDSTDQRRRNLWITVILALFALRALVLVAQCFVPVTSPHVHRQIDTMGVAARYWLRWTVEGIPPPPAVGTGNAASVSSLDALIPLLPAVLNSGDTQGIMPMELPLLNWLASPAFSLGPVHGMAAAKLLLASLVLLLTVSAYRVWRNQEIVGCPVGLAVLAQGFFSIAALHYGRFIPDTIAMLLAVTSMGLAWQGPSGRQTGKKAAAMLLTTTALLMKPTAVIVYFLLLLEPPGTGREAGSTGLGQRLHFLFALVTATAKRHLAWLAPAVAATAAYYLFGTHAVRRYVETYDFFAVGIRPPWQALGAFFAQPESLLNLIGLKLLFPGGVFIIAWDHFRRWRTGSGPGTWPLWLILTLQTLAIAVLDGDHSYVHDYYFIGVSLTAALLLLNTWLRSPQRWLKAVMLVIVIVRVGELSFMELGFAGSQKPRAMRNLMPECEKLRSDFPDLPWGAGKPFRSPEEIFPRLGLCFLERQNSPSAPYGFFYTDEPLPSDCRWLAQEKLIGLAACGDK